MVGWCGDLAKGCFSEAYPSCASGESTVHSLLEGILGRGVNLPGSAVFARGRARARRDRVL
jgi:hypothetical protein